MRLSKVARPTEILSRLQGAFRSLNDSTGIDLGTAIISARSQATSTQNQSGGRQAMRDCACCQKSLAMGHETSSEKPQAVARLGIAMIPGGARNDKASLRADHCASRVHSFSGRCDTTCFEVMLLSRTLLYLPRRKNRENLPKLLSF